MDFVLPKRATAVSATGLSHVAGGPENIAYLTLFFDQHLIAHVHVNWLAPVKVRRTLIGGSRKMIVYDDLEAEREDQGLRQGDHAHRIAGRRLPDARRLPHGRHVGAAAGRHRGAERRGAHFVECIEHDQVPTTDGEAGLRVVRILEAATESMAQRGKVGRTPAGGSNRMIPFLDLKAQYASIKPEIDAAVVSVLDSCQFALGDEVAAFEKEFAAYACAAEAASA